ncbi:MAG: signal transduction histidine kinase/CheY-like chemotaxis protein [Phenylobacterium sp.]|jgi:signal transduction histidine kinase/CheY-like chemotaxis protein
MKNNTNTKFTRSIFGRMILFGIVPTVLILLFIIIFATATNYSAALVANENFLKGIASKVAAEVERANAHSVVVAKTMAHAQENGLYGNRIASTAYARQILVAFPEFTGTCFCYEPNGDQNDLQYLSSDKGKTISKNALNKEGRFIPYWYRGNTAKDKDTLFIDNLLDMDTSLYYQGNKEQFLKHQVSMPMITEPYIYEGKMIMEHTYPIIIDGQFKGVSCIDRSLNAILAFVKQIKDREKVDIFLISRLGKFISATSDNASQLVTKAIADTPYRDLFGQYYRQKDPDLLALAEDPLDHQQYYFGSALVETGSWTVIVRKSEEAVLAPIRNNAYSQLGFALLGLLIISIFSFKTSRSISLRIGNAAKAADLLASGGLSKDIDLDSDIDDEIGQMNDSFNKVMERFWALTDVCVSISEGDFSKTVEVKSDRDILSEAINSMSNKRRQAEEALKSAQNKAEAANTAKSVFISSMSHEIRTPLNAIMGYSQILERSEGLSEQQRVDIVAIYRSGKHLLSIINDILDFSKIEAGKMELHPADFDLQSMIQDLFVIFTMRCEEKGLSLKIEGLDDQEKIYVRSDSVKLRQILVNLIGNAVKFTEQGTVTLLITPLADNAYTFEVKDTGPGIAEEKQTSIFKAFQQDEEGIKQGGTGLGLTISKTLLHLLESDLNMESVFGQGSRFYFTLVLAPARQEEAVSNSPFAQVSKLLPGQSVKAILIDDVQENLDVLERVLTEIGVQCVKADNGEGGLALIHHFEPDIVFSDYHMQGVDGLEVTRRIRKDHDEHNIKVVMISASVFEHHQQMYREQGVDGFVGKPFVREDIFEVMAQLLDVEYQYNLEADLRPREQRVMGLDISCITLPEELLNTIINAAKSGQVTKVEEFIEYLDSESLVADNLLQHLKGLAEDLDLDGILNIVEKIRTSES